MACEVVIDSWTISELVGAFLDIAIVYFLLCGSTLAYFTSRFLRLFGLSLPCPCNGRFANPTKNGDNVNTKCLQRFLVDCPAQKIGDVQGLVMKKFPYDLILADKSDGRSEEGEASCAFRNGIRRRRRNGVSSSLFGVNAGTVLESPKSEIKQESVDYVDFGDDGHECLDDSKGACKENINVSLEWDESVDGFKAVENESSPVEKIKSQFHGKLDFDDSVKDMVVALEQALENEHAARVSLYLELEKERNAAGIAADEAMAMILRLQEDKAVVEMEARQYQRMIEEKSAYDAEEMNILKEILLRREREKHFLEKEAEVLRQMVVGNEELSSLYSSEDPAMTLQQLIAESIGNKEPVKYANDLHTNNVASVGSQNLSISLGEELPMSVIATDDDSSKLVHIHSDATVDKDHYLSRSSDEISPQGIQMIPAEMITVDKEREVQVLAEYSPHDSINLGEEQEQSDCPIAGQGLSSKKSEDSNGTKAKILQSDVEVEKSGISMPRSVHYGENYVHDVHVISDEANGNEMENPSLNFALNIPGRCSSPSISRFGIEKVMSRSVSDTLKGLPFTGISQRKTSLSDFRRNSMSAFDYERLKIDGEIGWLRERLKVVQEGREKLNDSVGYKENQKTELQLLEDIAKQLLELRQLTRSEKAARRVSLPPLSKDMSKKKRQWRSVSLGEQRST